ncbi:MAG: hypothetical protein ACK4EY_11050 [Flavipsychrobacter sp.]
MKLLTRGLPVLLLSCLAVGANAQNISEDEGILSKKEYARYLGFGVGTTYQSFYDEVLSSKRYDKIGVAACISNTKINDVKYTELMFQGSMLNMERKSDELVNQKIKYYKAFMDYRHMYKLAVLDENIYDVRAGALFSTLFGHRYAPALANTGNVYEYAISVGLTGKVAREQTFSGRRGHIIWDLSIPFFTNTSRPSYMNVNEGVGPTNKALTQMFANNTITAFGKYMRINSRLHILYPLKNGNKLKFTYQWDYYTMKGGSGEKVYTAEHTFMLNYQFNY